MTAVIVLVMQVMGSDTTWLSQDVCPDPAQPQLSVSAAAQVITAAQLGLTSTQNTPAPACAGAGVFWVLVRPN